MTRLNSGIQHAPKAIRRRAALALAAATVALPASVAHAGATPGSGLEFKISTTGATALGNFTRGDAAGVPGTAIINLGVNSLTIGASTYTLDADGESLGFKVRSGGAALDTWAYYYHETGSVEGILELADGYGLTPGINRRPFDATSSNPVYINGNRYNATPILLDTGTAVDGSTLAIRTTGANINSRNGWVLGRNYLNTDTADPDYGNLSKVAGTGNTFHIGPNVGGNTVIDYDLSYPPNVPLSYNTWGKNTSHNPEQTPGTVPGGGVIKTNQFGQDLAKVAWSDIPTIQTFANAGTASPDARPSDDPNTVAVESSAGYGKGRNQGSSNFQKLRDITSIAGGQANFKNESLAVVPFAVVANPRSGLATFTESDVKWLHAKGQLSNGANFNAVTRDPGSGTRNQGGNNVRLDPSYAVGERDRIVPNNTMSFIVQDPDGNNVRLLPGDEGRPLTSYDNTLAVATEDRPSPRVHFADKTSGGSRLAPIVTRSGMGVGTHLSVGDVIARTSAYDNALNTNNQVRVIAIDWEEQGSETDGGFVQPTGTNVTEGLYQMWSYSQAITVRESTNPLDAGFNNIRPHDPLTHKTQYTAPQEAVLAGEHRKFLDNINGSAAALPAISNSTPGTGILQAGFIVTQIMGTQKAFDGGVQVGRTRSSIDPDGPGGPLLSEQDLYDAWRTEPTLAGVLDFAVHTNFEATVPGYNPNAESLTQVYYDIYRAGNTNPTPNNPNVTNDALADANIVITQRVALIGDFNNDQVRDLADVAAMAKAYANPDAYLADATLGGPGVEAAAKFSNGAGAQSRVAAALNGGLAATGAAVPGKFGLMVLSDFNTNGNISPADNNIVAVERADVRWFLYGAAVDTRAFATAKEKRELGVRLGQLKKNLAIDNFNTSLDGFVGSLTNPLTVASYTQDEVNELKFEKRDVNGSGSRGFTAGVTGDRNFLDDALIVDKFQGKRYTNLNDQIDATIPQRFTLNAADAAGIALNGGSTERWIEVGYNLVDAELNDSADGLIDQADLDVANQALTTTAGVNAVGRVDHSWRPSTTKSGAGTISMAAATGTIAVPVSGATFTIQSGTFAVGGALDPFTDSAVPTRHLNIVNSTASSLGITAGLKKVASLSGVGSTSVSGGGTVLEATHVRQGSLSVGAGATTRVRAGGGAAGTSVVGSLSLSGLLDLTDHALITSATPAAVDAFVTAGFNGGLWDGVSGISSSLAASDPDGVHAVGFAANAELGYGDFAGQPAGLSDVLAAYTLYGDLDLDFDVDGDDFTLFGAGFNGEPGTSPTWLYGDLDFDDDVDGDDFTLFGVGYDYFQANGFGGGGGSPAAVPEPTTLGLLAAGALGLLGRRRRRARSRRA